MSLSHIWTLTRLEYKIEMSLIEELIDRYGLVFDMDEFKKMQDNFKSQHIESYN